MLQNYNAHASNLTKFHFFYFYHSDFFSLQNLICDTIIDKLHSCEVYLYNKHIWKL